MPVRIRPAVETDAEAIARVHFAAVRGTAAHFYPVAVIESWSHEPDERRFDRFRSESADPSRILLVADEDGTITGFGVVDLPSSEVRAVFVDPRVGRRGIGGLILAELERRAVAQGVSSLQLKASLNAERFYLRHGYLIDERGTHKLPSGVDMACVMMSKSLRTEYPPAVACVPVAAAFLERLLFETSAIDAVHTLSGIWSCRSRSDLPYFGLSKAEYIVQLCLIYSGEVSNGGHSQFFSNRGGRHVRDTLEALEASGLAGLASILQQGSCAFPAGFVPADRSETEAALGKFTEDQRRTFDELDRRAFRLLPSVDPQLLTYIRASRDQVLVPETPLALRIGRSAL